MKSPIKELNKSRREHARTPTGEEILAQSPRHQPERAKRPKSTPALEGSRIKRPNSRISEPGTEVIRVGSPNKYVSETREPGHNRSGSSRSLNEETPRSVSYTSLHSMELGDHSREGSPTPSTGSTDSSKKVMLRYMLHEVRKIKRQIDPNLPDFHVRPRGRSGDSDNVFDESQDLEGFEESMEVDDTGNKLSQTIREGRKLPSVPGSKSLNKTYPPPGGSMKEYRRSFSAEEKKKLLSILKE